MRSDLPAGWAIKRLDELAEINASSVKDWDPATEIRYIDISAVSEAHGISRELERFPLGDAPSRAKRVARAGDVIVSMVRPERRSFGRIGSELDGAVVSTGFSVLRARPGVADDRFLFGVIRNSQFTQAMVGLQTGSNYPAVRPGDVGAYEVLSPPFEEQGRIARVLGSLDDKIEVNRRMAESLEQIAAALFKPRFVDFVGAEEFEESDIGPIPRGWGVKALDELGQFVNGGAFTKHANGRGRPILRIKELKGGLTDATPCTDHEVEDKHLARHYDLLFSWSGTLDVFRWVGPEAVINQHIFKVIPGDEIPSWLVEGAVRVHLPRFQAIAADKATTMGHIQRGHLGEAKLAVPPEDIIREWDEQIGAIGAQRSAVLAEIETLTAIRDGLLPKLISGEIRVPEGFGPDADPTDLLDGEVPTNTNQEPAAAGTATGEDPTEPAETTAA